MHIEIWRIVFELTRPGELNINFSILTILFLNKYIRFIEQWFLLKNSIFSSSYTVFYSMPASQKIYLTSHGPQNSQKYNLCDFIHLSISNSNPLSF